MRLSLFVLIGVACMAISVTAHKSVKNLKPAEEDKHVHHMMQVEHRMRHKVHGSTVPTDLSHHELMLREAGHHAEFPRSPAHHHRVGPQYTHHTYSAPYKTRPRFDSMGDHIPQEIEDDTLHDLHHK